MRQPALIFDFGNVFAFFDYARACDTLGRGIGISGFELLAKARARGLNALLRSYESGRINSKQFAANMGELLDLAVPFEDFAAAWADIFWLNEPVARLVAGLKAKGYPLVLGSNTNELHANHFRNQFRSELAAFDQLVLSYQVGHVKPAREFYHACAAAAQAKPEKCVFIDDVFENVEGAWASGLRGLHFRDVETLHSDLSQLGVQIP